MTALCPQRYFRGEPLRFDYGQPPLHQLSPERRQERLRYGYDQAVTPAARVGVWDQVCTYGTFSKPSLNGKPLQTRFDKATCADMLQDFASRENDLFLDKRHEVTEQVPPAEVQQLDAYNEDLQSWGDEHALAWYNALVHVDNGRVVGYAPHAGAPSAPPSIEDLRRPDGKLPGNGLYALRSQVTPRGADPMGGIAAFRYVSPYFFQKKDGRSRLLNITATNDPFLDGVTLAMSASAWGQADKENPMEEMFARAGIMEADPPEAKMEKLGRYAAKLEDDTKKAAEALARMEAEKKQPAAAEGGGAPAAAGAGAGGESPAAMERRVTGSVLKLLGYPADPELAAEKRRAEQDLLQRFERTAKDVEARGKTQAEEDAQEWAQRAVSMGRWDGASKGDLPKTLAWLKEKRLQNAKDAEDLLFPEGKFQPAEDALLQRMTRGGAGIGAPDPREGADPVSAWSSLVAKRQAEEKAATGKPLRFVDAEAQVRKTNPAAFQAYTRAKMMGKE